MRFLCSHCNNIMEMPEPTYGQVVGCAFCEKDTLVPASRLALGAVLGDFVLKEPLGEYKLCTQHLAWQLSLGREVVLRILKGELAQDPEYVRQFLTEARFMARLVHANIVHSYAIAEDDGYQYTAIERVRGTDLQSLLLEQGELPLFHAIDIARQIALAIDYAWEAQRILHRDIKPGNIIWTEQGVAKLTGFRFACTADQVAVAREEDAIVGSPPYLSPEAVLGIPMDVRSDLYSLGATLYHLITGRLPFEANKAEEMLWKHLEEPLTPPNHLNPNLPQALSDLVYWLMHKDIEARPESAAAVAAELGQILTDLDQAIEPEEEAPADDAYVQEENSLDGQDTVYMDRGAPREETLSEEAYAALLAQAKAKSQDDEVYDLG
jgi:serine/threonine-protein kinase